MNTPLPRIRTGYIIVVLAFLSSLFSTVVGHAAEATPPGVLAFTVDVPGNKLSTEEITGVVRKVAIGRGWTVKESTSDKTVTYLKHRKNEATVTYLVTDKAVQVCCEGYATDANGARKGPEQPSGWLKFLKKDIVKDLNDAASGVKK